MRNRISGFLAILLATIVVSGIVPSIKAQPPAPAMWIEPATLNFSTASTHVGDKFNVTVWASTVSDVYVWQAEVLFNATQLAAVRAAYTAGTGSQLFMGHTTIPVSFVIDNITGMVMGAESLLGADVVHASNGSLFWIEFQILVAPTPGNTLTSLIDTNDPANSYLLDTELNVMTGVTLDHATYAYSAISFPLSVLISPSSASVSVNQTLLFTSSVTGGTPPYSFQWFLNGSAVPGATSGSWTFSSATSGTFAVYLNATDSLGATAKSNVATVTVSSVSSVVTPPVIEGTLRPGETEHDTITVNLPSSTPKGDVVFIFDTTGSMSWVIANMQTKAIAMMNSISAVIPDTAFGVGSFCDYPHSYTSYDYSDTYGAFTDYAFRMDQDITTNTTAVSNAISSIVYGSGADGPEDYTRAIWESLHYGWRTGAKRIVVLFGDAPPHSAPSGLNLTKPWNPSELLFSSAYGGDPGPDEIMFTADDLDYGPVVQQVKDNHITFVCVDCQSSSGPGFSDDAHNNFNYTAYMTGGAVFPYTSGTIADDITARISATAHEPIHVLTLEPDVAYASWVSWSPTSYYNVSWGTSVSFDVNITIPTSTPPGDYTFGINVVGDGVTLGTVKVIKHVLATPQTRELKKDAIAELQAAENLTINKQTIEKIDGAIEEIQESLDPSLWVDDFHLDPKHGFKVFDEEKDAVGKLLWILKDKKESTAVKNVVQTVKAKLLQVDQVLANTAIIDAKALNSTDPRVIHEIKEADKDFLRAMQEIAKGNYENAVEEFKHAWMNAQHAMNKAFGDVNADGKVDMKDVGIVARAFGSSAGKPNWDSLVDLNGDNKVDMRDVGIVCSNFGINYN
jgi:uncharacterized protein (DUF2141 family)